MAAWTKILNEVLKNRLRSTSWLKRSAIRAKLSAKKASSSLPPAYKSNVERPWHNLTFIAIFISCFAHYRFRIQNSKPSIIVLIIYDTIAAQINLIQVVNEPAIPHVSWRNNRDDRLLISCMYESEIRWH